MTSIQLIGDGMVREGRVKDDRIWGRGSTEQTFEGWVGYGRTEVNPSWLKGV